VLSAEDPNYLPLVMVRCAQDHLVHRITECKQRLQTLFGKEIEISYDLRNILTILALPRNINKLEARIYQQEGALEKAIPKELAVYFDNAVRKLESLNFNLDELYKTEWLNAAPKGIMFEVVEKLQTNASYNECIYGEGYFRLRTTPQYFGLSYGTIAERVIDQL